MKSERQPASILILLLGLLQIAMVLAIAFTPAAQSADASQPVAQPNDLLSPSVDALVRQSDLIIRAQVITSTSQWNIHHTLIETVHTIAIRYALVGESPRPMLVYTEGGFLPAEGLGMRSSHTAAFTPQEEVLVFLQKGTDGYETVRGEFGKFTVFNTEVGGSGLQQQQSIEQVIQSVKNAATRQGRPLTLPENWRTYEPTTFVRQLAVPNQPWIDPKWPGAQPKVRAEVNLNSTHIGGQGGSQEQFLQAIKNALRAWSVIESAEFTLLYTGASTAISTGFNNKSEIVFMHKGLTGQLGQAQIWYTNSGNIVEADLWINDDYAVDATGALQANEIDIESVVLHELGHWAPLGHVDAAEAVMYPVLGNGVRKVTLASDDINRLSALYPCPSVPCIDPVYANDSTPTQIPTPDPIILATTTPTPSATPTAVTTPATTQEPTATPAVTVTRLDTPQPSPAATVTATLIATQAPTTTPAAINFTPTPPTTKMSPITLFLPIITR